MEKGRCGEMLKNSGILLTGGAFAALLLGGCGGNSADTADTAPVTPPVRAAKPTAPGTAATDAATPAADKSGAAAGGKSDPFQPAGGKQAKAAPKSGAKKAPGAPTAAQAGIPGAPGAAPAAPGAPAVPGTPAAPGAPAVPGTKVASIDHKKDPFLIDWKRIPPPPYVFNDPSIQPLRIASQDVETPPVGDVAVREVANRRVAGIMSGDGVFAIIETAGSPDAEIVKPGSQTRDGYRVVSISADSVKLQRKDGNIVRTQIVPLTDQSLNGQPTGGGSFGGFPSSGGGRGGMPGSGLPPGVGRRPGGTLPGGAGRRPGGGGGGGNAD